MEETARVYDKAYHFWDSPAVFFDIDTIVYISLLAVAIWLIVLFVRKRNNSRRIGIIEFLSRFMLLCSLPIFLLYLCQLIPSGWYTLNSVSICVLPIVYGGLVQLIFYGIRKLRERKMRQK